MQLNPLSCEIMRSAVITYNLIPAQTVGALKYTSNKILEHTFTAMVIVRVIRQ